MERLIFTLVLVLTAGIISVITGRNRRQMDRIPPGMVILCQPPGRRYVVYALGVLVFIFVMIFSVLYIMDGAPEEARFMWSLCVIMAVVTLIITTLCGNMMARDCVYFNSQEIRIEKPFRKPRVLTWNEIRKIDGSFDNTVNLYLLDGTKILTARIDMVNYEHFCDVLKRKCPEIAAGYYRTRTYDQPQKCVLRYGREYFLLAGMGILIMLMYLAILFSAEDVNLAEELLQSDPSQLFSLLFAPVCGLISLIALFVLINTKIQYSPEKLILQYPLRRKRELYWRNIQRAELIPAKKREESWKTLRLYTQEGMYRLNLGLLTYGQDAFMTELFKMMKKYEIPYN